MRVALLALYHVAVERPSTAETDRVGCGADPPNSAAWPSIASVTTMLGATDHDAVWVADRLAVSIDDESTRSPNTCVASSCRNPT